MDISNYLIAQEGLDWAELLSDWNWLLPNEYTIWLVNHFGDIVLVSEDGSVQFLDIGNGTLDPIASDRNDFITRIDNIDNANQWLLIPFVDLCVQAGMTLNHHQCYGFAKSPIFGGDYVLENIQIADLSVHYGVLGQIHHQLQGIPDGTKIKSISIQDA